MEVISLLFLAAYTVLILWGLGTVLRSYKPSGRALQFPRMAKSLGVSIAEIADSSLAIHLPTADLCCANCTDKDACEAWLATHDCADKAPEFCANASYLRLARG